MHEASSPRPLRILVVEDFGLLRGLLCRYLQSNGHIPKPAATLAEARAALRNAEFDTLFADLELPDGDGSELLRELPPFCSFISCSGFADRRRDPAEERWLAHLGKPFPIDQFVATLHQAGQYAVDRGPGI